MRPNPRHAMKGPLILLASSLLIHGAASAQDDIPLLIPEEREKVDAQTDEFNNAIKPALAEASKSAVRIWSGKRRLAYGTVVTDGSKILTKWSEVARAGGSLLVEAGNGETRSAKVSGVYEDEDLALLEIAGAPLTPVRWSPEKPALGSFLAAPQPDGRPAAFGVVSVLERNLRETDQAFLGVEGDPDFKGPGVRITGFAEPSGASAAGLRRGDIILKVGERPVSGLLELKNSLNGITPGTTVKVIAKAADGEKTFDVVLGSRPDFPDFLGDRLRVMERMGGPLSRVRDSFGNAIQSDMRPRPDQIGGPVADLKGGVIGITLARADRTRSFIMPAEAVEKLLEKPGTDPSLASVRQPEETAAVPVQGRRGEPRQRMVPPAASEERMRRHLSEMQRLMDHMREEMDALENGRR